MKLRVFYSVFGAAIGVVLAVMWGRARAETRALAAERGALNAAEANLVAGRAALERRLIETESKIGEQKRAVLATQTAADRARATVGPLVARLKAAHAGRKTNRPPDPPTPAGGASIFPELMADPEYSALYAKRTRLSLSSYQGGKLRKLGVAEGVIEKAIDLLTEEQVSVADVHSLAGSSPMRPPSGEMAKLQQQVCDETEAQLKALLGEEICKRFKGGDDPSPQDVAIFATRPVEQRLSYSEEPLTLEQIERLRAFEAGGIASAREYYQKQRQLERESRKTGVIPVDEAKLAFYRSVLTPRQMEAVDELHAEGEARFKRELLPKYVERKATGAK